MTKAYADQRLACIADLADEIFERGNKGQVIVCAVFGAGDQPSVGVVDAVGEFHVHHVEGHEFQIVPPKQALEHRVIVAVVFVYFRCGVAGLQNADLHESPDLIKFPQGDGCRPALM